MIITSCFCTPIISENLEVRVAVFKGKLVCTQGIFPSLTKPNVMLWFVFLWVCILKGNEPHVEVSMLVGSHMMAEIPQAAGSHHKGFSDPLFLESKTRGRFSKDIWGMVFHIRTDILDLKITDQHQRGLSVNHFISKHWVAMKIVTQHMF